MLLSIFEWLTQCLSGVLEIILNLFMRALDLELSSYLEAFPILADVYSLLQTVSLGLALVIAAVGCVGFIVQKSTEGRATDRPQLILLRAMVAVGLIYGGGHILEYIVQLAAWSFKIFKAMDVSDKLTHWPSFDITGIAQALVGLALGITPTELTLVALGLILVGLVTYNVLKLTLEVAERYLLVGVLVFTSPLVYCTLVTSSTSDIFKRWVRMFISSCIMMSFSALFLKLVVNGLCAVEVSTHFFMQIVLVLAMCKIAQRVDSYLNQLGLTTAVTGGNMLEDLGGMLTVARTAGNALNMAFNGQTNASKGSVLGANAGKAASAASGGAAYNKTRGGGVAAAVADSIKSGRAAFVNGGSASDVWNAAKDAGKDALNRTPIAGAMNARKEALENGGDIKEAMKQGATAGFAANIASVFPGAMNERQAVETAKGQQQNAENAAAHTEARARTINPTTGQNVPQNVSDTLHGSKAKPVSEFAADSNFAAYGVAQSGKSAMSVSGQKTAAEYRTDAAAKLGKADPEFAKAYSNYVGSQNGTFSPSDKAHYMSESDFNAKWGSKLDAATNAAREADMAATGGDLQLSDNALASGLTMELDENGQSYVSGRENQMGALFANEYNGPSPVPSPDNIGSVESYKDQAIEDLSAGIAPEGFNVAQFNDDKAYLSGDEFLAKYDDQITARAQERRDRDAESSAMAGENYRNTLTNSVEHASPNAVLHGFYDHTGDMSGNDELGNAMMERGFTAIAAERQEGTAFHDISAHDTPDRFNAYTGETLHGGRVVEADYTNADGEERHVAIYDQAAYTSMPADERENMSPYRASDNRMLWVKDAPAAQNSDSNDEPSNPNTGSTNPNPGTSNPNPGTSNPNTGSTNPSAGTSGPNTGSTNPSAGTSGPNPTQPSAPQSAQPSQSPQSSATQTTVNTTTSTTTHATQQKTVVREYEEPFVASTASRRVNTGKNPQNPVKQPPNVNGTTPPLTQSSRKQTKGKRFKRKQ